jgi:hypothetical protein
MLANGASSLYYALDDDRHRQADRLKALVKVGNSGSRPADGTRGLA